MAAARIHVFWPLCNRELLQRSARGLGEESPQQGAIEGAEPKSLRTYRSFKSICCCFFKRMLLEVYPRRKSSGNRAASHALWS